ncbi:MAG: Asd/ArgC dimerization domain-containing protein [Bryobacteraceae bacterium]
MAIVAIVGGESLIGRDLRDLIGERKLYADVRLVGTGEATATLTEQDGEAVVITPLDEGTVRDAQLVFLAGSPDSTRKAVEIARKSGLASLFIDLTYAMEDDPAARLRSPYSEPEGFAAPPEALSVIAHPAAITLAMLLKRLRDVKPIVRVMAHVFEPASERGQEGLNELQKQTVNLLSFQPLPKRVFDAQIGFAMLPSYGSEAPEPLESFELRIEKHLATLLAGIEGVPMPSIRLIQAPVFHGYSISLHVEFSDQPDLAKIASVLGAPEVDVRGPDVEAPTNVGIAGQGGIAVGAIAADRNAPCACWFWIVADNFRLMVENAVAVAQSLLPGGKRNKK